MNIRYQLCPQMKIYDQIGYQWLPNIMFNQNPNYKSEILTKNVMKVSIEASETSYWKKYTGTNGLNFGIDGFGKSAPYKDIYDHFKLNEENIINKIKEKI